MPQGLRSLARDRAARTDRTRAWLLGVSIAVLAYSGLHFVRSGILFPWSTPNLGQIEEEATPLRQHLESGQPITTNNPRQYGPTFLFVLEPFLRLAGDDDVALGRSLYIFSLLLFAGSFAFTLATLWPFMPASRRTLTIVLLLVIWLNFAPAYAILAVKNVEIWELFLLSAALFALVRGHRAAAGTAVALAALTKLLPFAFFYYLLLRDRRTLAYAFAALFLVLLASHARYGPVVGLQYLPRVVQAATTHDTWALLWHENISAKGMVVKMFGNLEGKWDPAYADRAMGGMGHAIVIEPVPLVIAQTIGLELQAIGAMWLTWIILRRRHDRSAETIVSEWSLVSVMMLILSPQTAFEYTTLALGAFSYGVVRLCASMRQASALAWASFAGAVFLVANIVPRTLVARVLMIDRINQWTMYGQLSPTEGFQYYGFPLLGLLLLVVSLCALAAQSSSARVSAPAVAGA